MRSYPNFYNLYDKFVYNVQDLFGSDIEIDFPLRTKKGIDFRYKQYNTNLKLKKENVVHILEWDAEYDNFAQLKLKLPRLNSIISFINKFDLLCRMTYANLENEIIQTVLNLKHSDIKSVKYYNLVVTKEESTFAYIGRSSKLYSLLLILEMPLKYIELAAATVFIGIGFNNTLVSMFSKYNSIEVRLGKEISSEEDFRQTIIDRMKEVNNVKLDDSIFESILTMLSTLIRPYIMDKGVIVEVVEKNGTQHLISANMGIYYEIEEAVDVPNLVKTFIHKEYGYYSDTYYDTSRNLYFKKAALHKRGVRELLKRCPVKFSKLQDVSKFITEVNFYTGWPLQLQEIRLY